eukprot:CAMPEP_0178772550 /NCGR_PEP_ID=MMETSP0744-20121128/22612_1 /TAXON_ID=913974 /ORGANISM="Nitzschia punctata, Strain CCMP561" /LENGTH=536 /DNA_ID=CAMNT_0020429255 /DNA_START=202 /DNA_END=1812 /DNA_ORIENTATION=-
MAANADSEVVEEENTVEEEAVGETEGESKTGEYKSELVARCESANNAVQHLGEEASGHSEGGSREAKHEDAESVAQRNVCRPGQSLPGAAAAVVAVAGGENDGGDDNNEARSKNAVRTSEVSPNDILCGRGAPISRHDGNLRMHRIVSEYRERYLNSSRNDKAVLIHEVIGRVKQDGARFLKRMGNSDLWVEVDNETVYDKVSHALRGQANNRRQQPRPRDVPSAGVEAGVPPPDIGISDPPPQIGSLLQQRATAALVADPIQRLRNVEQGQTPNADLNAVLGLLRPSPQPAVAVHSRNVDSLAQQLVGQLSSPSSMSGLQDSQIDGLLASLLAQPSTTGHLPTDGSALDQRLLGLTGMHTPLTQTSLIRHLLRQQPTGASSNYTSALANLGLANLLDQSVQQQAARSGVSEPTNLLSSLLGASASTNANLGLTGLLGQSSQNHLQPQTSTLASLLESQRLMSGNVTGAAANLGRGASSDQNLHQIRHQLLLQNLRSPGAASASSSSVLNSNTGSTVEDTILALLLRSNNPSSSPS